MTVSKTPNGRWRVRVKSGRDVVASRTFDLKRDAEAWEALQKRSLDLGDFVDPRVGKTTFNAVIEQWLTERQGTVASSTFQADTALLRNISVALGRRPIASVREPEVEALLNGLSQRGLSRGSVTRFRAVLSTMFNWAVRQRMIKANPVLAVRVPAGTGMGTKHEVFPLSVDELREVVINLSRNDPRQAQIALVLGLTGLRWGELVALRVRDVTLLPRAAFRVSRSAPDGHEVRNRTKGGSARSVPLTAELIPVVSRWMEGKSPDDLVFTSVEGGRLNGANWRRAVQWSTHNRGRRIHDLRHSAATFWLSSGVDPKTVQTWLGHASMTLTVDLYAHWMGSEASEAAINRIDAILGDAGGTRTGKWPQAAERHGAKSPEITGM